MRLYNYETGADLGEATPEQESASMDAGESGGIHINPETGEVLDERHVTWMRNGREPIETTEPYLAVYVSE